MKGLNLRSLRFRVRTLMLVITLLCVYLGSYLAILSPVTYVNAGHHGIVLDGYREADYSVGGPISHAVFAPVHWLDCQVRPNYWNDAVE